MIDLHSNTAFSLGSANQNMELFPYIDKTWFGEGFNFDLMPADFWLTEVSGSPFGVVNDILMHMSCEQPQRHDLWNDPQRICPYVEVVGRIWYFRFENGGLLGEKSNCNSGSKECFCHYLCQGWESSHLHRKLDE